jgi:hypothetical protein
MTKISEVMSLAAELLSDFLKTVFDGYPLTAKNT